MADEGEVGQECGEENLHSISTSTVTFHGQPEFESIKLLLLNGAVRLTSASQQHRLFHVMRTQGNFAYGEGIPSFLSIHVREVHFPTKLTSVYHIIFGIHGRGTAL